MALLQPEFDTGDILVVGDGNFSFSLCLAEALVGQEIVIIFATSLDPRSSLEDDQMALQNLRKLSNFQNVNVLHEVDGTNLVARFPSKKFRRIIFNFPHVGGKSKINLARLLLERFFTSAAGHIEADGDICVSLCQGQGGTPADNPAREYGNTWQVVSQASKTGLILNAVWPFQGGDYPHYLSAGFRGRLGTRFHTKGGLTHKFVQGISLGMIPDVKTFVGQQGWSMGAPLNDKLQLLPVQHPICLMKKRVDHFFNSCTGAPFKTINPESLTEEMKRCTTANQQKGIKTPEAARGEQGIICGINLTGSISELTKATFFSEIKGEKGFYDRIQQCLMDSPGSFTISGMVVDHRTPVSRNSYPISHRMAVVRVAEKDSRTEIRQELRQVLSNLTEDIFPNVKTSNHTSVTKTCAKFNAPQLLEMHENIEKSTVEKSTVGLSKVLGTECKCDSQGAQCIFCRLEVSYLGLHEMHQPTCFDSFVDLSTICEFYHQDKLLLSCGLLAGETMGHSGALCGWMIIINLDNLVAAVCEIPDARLLWSCDPKFLKQFTNLQAEKYDGLVKFTPFNLYPMSFTHDISFWLTEETTEMKFFEAIFKTTQDCVGDVVFRERYHDKEQEFASYNYRMIYSRCDGPLTHLQAVEMQNLLRRYLISCGFGLK